MGEQARPSELPFIAVHAHFKEIAQALLTSKASARTVESNCQALVPLATEATAAELRAIAASAKNLSEQLSELYSQIARHAFSEAPS